MQGDCLFLKTSISIKNKKFIANYLISLHISEQSHLNFF